MHVARIAGKASGGSYVLRGRLLGLLLGKRKGAPPEKGVESRASLRSSRSTPPKNSGEPAWRPKRAWQSAVDTTSAGNDRRPPSGRTYFSSPQKIRDIAAGDAERKARSVSPKSRSASPKVDTFRKDQSARARSTTPRRRLDHDESGFITSHAHHDYGSRFVWGADDPDLKVKMECKKPWSNVLDVTSESNCRRSKFTRQYFKDIQRRDTQFELKEKMEQRRMTVQSMMGTTSRRQPYC